MAKNDWAVVVGINAYPGLSNLDGPRNDAEDFYNWLISETGGSVPKDHITLILSPDPPPSTPTDAVPTTQQIEAAFDHLDDVATQDPNGRVGRRLYLYFSGHGFSPDFEQAALLMANANQKRTGQHILGRPYADWFFRSGYFQEVVLFMDCCQEKYSKTVPRPIHFNEVTDFEAIDKGKRFYGFGTKWSRLAQERMMEDGKVHGVFTTALLKGLSGAAADSSGNITATSLGDWLYNNMHKLLSEDALKNDAISKEPDLDYEKNPQKPFLFTTVNTVPKFKVNVHVPAASATKTLRVRGDKFALVASEPAVSPVTELFLPRGLYLAEIAADGLEINFEVTGLGEEDVKF
ncbi:MAG TPA: caspase family protein [Blastocatellia bacterium]|nr:caspase family protein [Blastocatellia bacterium]